jgi:hypothetical protein
MEPPSLVYNPVNNFGSVLTTPGGGLSRQIYAADDHFLISEGVGINEDYLRVMFKDIRYIIYKKTEPPIMDLIFGVLFLLCWGFGLIFLIRYFRYQGSCACYLVTDVQTIRVPLPSDYSKVPAFINVLRSQMKAYGSTSFAP